MNLCTAVKLLSECNTAVAVLLKEKACLKLTDPWQLARSVKIDHQLDELMILQQRFSDRIDILTH